MRKEREPGTVGSQVAADAEAGADIAVARRWYDPAGNSATPVSCQPYGGETHMGVVSAA